MKCGLFERERETERGCERVYRSVSGLYTLWIGICRISSHGFGNGVGQRCQSIICDLFKLKWIIVGSFVVHSQMYSSRFAIYTGSWRTKLDLMDFDKFLVSKLDFADFT